MIEDFKDRFINFVKQYRASEIEEMLDLLSKCNSTEADSFLARQLTSTQWAFRHNAAILLENRPSAVSVIREAMLSDNEDLVYWGSRILMKIDPQSEDFLREKYKNTSRITIKLYILRTLRGSKADESIELFIGALVSGPGIIREQAAECLEEVGKKGISHLMKAFDSYIATSESSPVCYYSLKILTRLMQEDILPFLLKKRKSRRPFVRYYALAAMEELGGETAILNWIAALSDNSWIIRKLAEKQLVSAGSLSVPYLKAAFKTENPDRKYVIIQLLGRISHQTSIQSLLYILRSEVPDTRYYALTALAEMGIDSLPYLINAFNDDIEIIRHHIQSLICEKYGIRAIGRLKSTIITYGAEPQYQQLVFWCLGTLKKLWPASMEDLNSIVLNTPYPVCLQALQGIKEADTELITPIDVIAPLLTHEKWLIRRTAADMLGRYSALVLPQLLEHFAGTDDQEIIFWLKEILLEMPSDIIEALSKLYDQGKTELNDLIDKLLEALGPGLIKDKKRIINSLMRSERHIQDQLIKILEGSHFQKDIQGLFKGFSKGEKSDLFDYLDGFEILMTRSSYGANPSLVRLWSDILFDILRNRDQRMENRSKALDIIVRQGGESIVELMRELQDSIDEVLMRQLKQSLEFEEGKSAGLVFWESYKESKNEQDAWTLLSVMKKIDIDDHSMEIIARESGSRDFGKRQKATEVLEALPHLGLKALLGVYHSDEDWFARKNYLTGIKRMYNKKKNIFLEYMGKAGEDDRKILEIAMTEDR